MGKSIDIRFKPGTWFSVGNPDMLRGIMYREWNICGVIVTLSELHYAGWALHIKQTHPAGRAKMVFTKDDSFISFKSHGEIVKRRGSDGWAFHNIESAFLNMEPIKLGFVEKTSRQHTRAERQKLQAKIDLNSSYGAFPSQKIMKDAAAIGVDIEDIPPEAMNQYYQVWAANKMAEPKPEPDTVLVYDADDSPTRPRTVGDILAQISDLDLMNEIISRQKPRKKRRKPLTPDNIIQIKKWLHRSEAILEDREVA